MTNTDDKNFASEPSPTSSIDDKGTSIGVKLMYVLITGFLSLIPLVGVDGILSLRDQYAGNIVRQLEGNLGGQQNIVGPVIVVPTRWADEDTYIPPRDSNGTPIERAKPHPFLFIPETLNLDADITTDRKTMSLYSVIGYDAEVVMSAQFDIQENAAETYQFDYPNPVQFDWRDAFAVVYMTNTSSANIRPEVTIADTSIALAPGVPPFALSPGTQPRSTDPNAPKGYSTQIGRYIQFSDGAPLSLETTLSFKGATQITVAPIGKKTELALSTSSTPASINPFNSEPLTAITSDTSVAYSHEWLTAGPYRNGHFPTFRADVASPLLAKQNFVAFFDAQNTLPYAEIKQAIKYGFFLMAFSFLTFFVFDALSGRYLHAAQYFLLGLIQTVFYAVLLAVSEFTGFEMGFMIAGIPTVLVTGLAVASILRSTPLGIMAVIIFGAFYSVQYILMDMAQYSLLVAAGAAFIAIAATLLATSRLDWGRFKKTA